LGEEVYALRADNGHAQPVQPLRTKKGRKDLKGRVFIYVPDEDQYYPMPTNNQAFLGWLRQRLLTRSVNAGVSFVPRARSHKGIFLFLEIILDPDVIDEPAKVLKLIDRELTNVRAHNRGFIFGEQATQSESESARSRGKQTPHRAPAYRLSCATR
jgi:hypothetical protein